MAEIKHQTQCPNCKLNTLELSEIISLDFSKEKNYRWKSSGSMDIKVCSHGLCSNCGYKQEAIETIIPIISHGLHCPKCKNQDLICELKNITTEKLKFIFNVDLSCSHKLCRFITSIMNKFQTLYNFNSLRLKSGVSDPAGNTYFIEGEIK